MGDLYAALRAKVGIWRRVARGLLGRGGYVRRYYVYYVLCHTAPRRVNHWLWRNSRDFREWWGAW